MPPLAADQPVLPGRKSARILGTPRRSYSGERIPEVSSLVLSAAQYPLLTFTLGLVLATCFIALAIAVIPAKYHSTAYVQVRQREDFLLTSQASRSEDAAFVRAQKLTVLQQQTLAQALGTERLQKLLELPVSVSNVDWLRDQLDVEIPSGSEVMTITGIHRDPEVAQAMADVVSQAYLEIVITNSKENRRNRLLQLEQAAKQSDINLSERWARLHQLAEELGAGNSQSLVVSEQVQLQNFREASQQMRSLQLQRSQLEMQLSELKRKRDRAGWVSDEQVRLAVLQRPEVIAKNERLNSVENKLREFRSVVADNQSPRIAKLQSERDFCSEQLESLVAELTPIVREKLEEERRDLQQVDIGGMEQQIALLKEEEEFVRKTLDSHHEELIETGGANSVDLEMLRHEIEREERLADNLWQTISEMKIEDQAKPRVSLIEPSKFPDSPNRSKQYKAAGVGGLLGMCLAVFAVGYYEWSMCRVRSPSDIADHLPIEIFGENTAPRKWDWLRWNSHRYQKLLSGVSEVAAQLILTSQSSGRVPCVFVTSATCSEPRDSVAVELARVLAHSGLKTILIDCDVDSQALPKRFGLPSSGRDRCRILRVVEPVVEDFDYLRGDGENSVSMTMPNGFNSLLQEIRTSYSAIVVHGPPILTNAESVLLATQVDVTIFAVLSEVTRWNLMNAAFHRLQFAGASVLGCVFHTPTIAIPQRSRRAQIATADSGCPLPISVEEQLQRELSNIRADIQRANTPQTTKDSKDVRSKSPS